MSACHLMRAVAWIGLLAGSHALVRAEEGSTLSGVVTDRASVPISGVTVTLGSIERVLQMRTLKDGRFEFGGLPDGAYELQVSAPGFVQQKLLVQTAEGVPQSFAIVLEIGNGMAECGAVSKVTYTALGPQRIRLTGTTMDLISKEPVRRAEIILWSKGEKRKPYKVRSDVTGRYMFHVPAGPYKLRIARRGYQDEEIEDLLLARESMASIESTLLESGRVVACQ